MSYRSNEFIRTAKGRNVLTIALEVKQTFDGSFHRSLEAQRLDVIALLEVLNKWSPSKNHFSFDKLVKDLIKEVLVHPAIKQRKWDVIRRIIFKGQTGSRWYRHE